MPYYDTRSKALDMKSTLCLITACFALFSSYAASAEESAKDLNKNEILKILEDNPYAKKSFPNSETSSSPWLIRTEIFDAFDTILKNKALREDPEVRSKLVVLSEVHPFTVVRASATFALSDVDVERFPMMFHFGGLIDGYDGPNAYEINESMEYCSPPSNARRPEFELEAERHAEELKLSGRERVRPNYIFSVPMRYGTITGGYYSIQGIGLTYKQNTTPHKKIGISRANNRYIMKSDTKDSYWLIDGPHHMIGGASISKLIENKDGLERYLHRVLPGTVSQVFELDHGRIFITFANLDPSKRGGTSKEGVFYPSPLERYNPPIIVYPNGQVSLACDENAIKY